MNITRRGFLGSILAAAVAPAIVRADSLMRIIPRDLVLATGGDVLLTQRVLIGGEGVLIQWIDDAEGGILHSQEFTSDGRFTVPKTATVWISAYGGGGGGSGKMISPTRDDQGQIFHEPMRVQRGTIIPVTVGKA